MLRVSILISTYQYSVLSSFGSIFYYNRMCISMHRVSILISTYQYSVFPSFCSIFYYNRMCLSMHRVSLISTQFSHHFVRFLLQHNVSLNAPRESYQYSVFPSFCSIFLLQQNVYLNAPREYFDFHLSVLSFFPSFYSMFYYNRSNCRG